MSGASGLFRRWLTVLVGIVAIALPSALLYSTRFQFYTDWPVNLYFIAYFGEYLRYHRDFPASFDNEAYAGLAFPVYYGFLYYRVAGLISAFVGCHVAVRVLIVTAIGLQFVCVRRAMRKLGAAEAPALLAACAVIA